MNVGRNNEEDKLKQFNLLFIYGSGRCGSTLLDLLLNGHSQITSLGEIMTLMTIINPFQLPDRFSIEFRQDYLEFWAKVREYYQAMTGESFDQINLGHPNWRTITTSWNEDHVQKWVHSSTIMHTSSFWYTSTSRFIQTSPPIVSSLSF